MIEAGKTYPLRGGLTARIGFTDKKGPRPISGLVDVGEREDYQTWFPNGRVLLDGNSDLDIVMPEPERKSLWSNFYNSDGRPKVMNLERALDTRALADKYSLPGRTHVLEIINKNGEPVEVKIHKVER